MSFSKVKILLDTTYLLPSLGVRVRGLEDVFNKLRKLYSEDSVELFYSPYSLLEALGKISKTRFDEKTVGDGLLSIIESNVYKEALPTPEAYLKALKLKAKGFRDLIDLILYTTALSRNFKLLTRDDQLIEFIKKVGEDATAFLAEDEI